MTAIPASSPSSRATTCSRRRNRCPQPTRPEPP
jgi:hypothetical protein